MPGAFSRRNRDVVGGDDAAEALAERGRLEDGLQWSCLLCGLPPGGEALPPEDATP